MRAFSPKREGAVVDAIRAALGLLTNEEVSSLMSESECRVAARIDEYVVHCEWRRQGVGNVCKTSRVVDSSQRPLVINYPLFTYNTDT